MREHDNGWREIDSAPSLDPRSGGPVDFRELPRGERFELWRRGLDRLEDTPYAQALVAHHALEIHRDRPAETWDEFRREVRERRDAARQAAGLAGDELAADYRHLELCDTVSLVACGAFPEARCRDHRLRRRGGTVEMDPFPLAGATTFQIPLRIIPEGPYRDPAHLIGQLAPARWMRRAIRLAPAGPAGV